jgi:hypothetical protein
VRLGFALLLAISLSSSAMAEESVVLLESEVVDLIADIESGRRDQAIERISGVFSLSGEPRQVRTSSEFVDVLLGCKSTVVKSRSMGKFSVHTLNWICDGKIYEVMLGKDPDSGYIEIAEFSDEDRMRERESKRKLAPRAVMPMLPESPEDRRLRLDRQKAADLNILAALEATFKANSIEPLLSVTKSTTNFRLGLRDMATSTFISEMDGEGVEEAKRQFEWLKTNLGENVFVECRQKPLSDKEFLRDSTFKSCTVKTDRHGHGFTAIYETKDDAIRWIEFSYVNEKWFSKNEDYLRKSGAI